MESPIIQLELTCDIGEQDYVSAHTDVIRRKLSMALALLLMEMHQADYKREVPIGHGMDGAVVVESARKAEAARLTHEAIFGTEAERNERVAQIHAATRQNSMVPEKTR
jgi:hypothetical protein